jgi:hypothetical protein
LSTKRLRHFSIRENAVRDAILLLDIVLSHIAGVRNPSDLFTKEHRDLPHFLSLVSCFLSSRVFPAIMGGVALAPQLLGNSPPSVPACVHSSTLAGTGTGK